MHQQSTEMKFSTYLEKKIGVQSVNFVPVMISSHNLYLSSLTICTDFSVNNNNNKFFSNSLGGGGSQFPLLCMKP